MRIPFSVESSGIPPPDSVRHSPLLRNSGSSLNPFIPEREFLGGQVTIFGYFRHERRVKKFALCDTNKYQNTRKTYCIILALF